MPVTVSRKLEDNCENVVIMKEDYFSEIDIQVEAGKVIFDVVSEEKYILKCL